MRIFIYEYLCAGGATGIAAASLAVEGWAMLSALMEDFRRLRGVTVETMLSGLVPDAEVAAHEGVVLHWVNPGEEKSVFHRLTAAADRTLVVAPEFDDVLATRLRWVNDAQGRSFNCTPDAAERTGDKLFLAAYLGERRVPTPATTCCAAPTPRFPAVLKPRFGAGSQATFLVHNEDELRRAASAAAGHWTGDLIVQPFVPGEAVSVSFLIGLGRRLAMPAVTQELSIDGRFRYQGGSLPLDSERNARATQIAGRAVAALEGLAGYVGVDVVLGTTPDGDTVIEINPRLTTSYVGLRALARFNLAEAILSVAEGNEPPIWEWRTDPLHFTADGRVIGWRG